MIISDTVQQQRSSMLSSLGMVANLTFHQVVVQGVGSKGGVGGAEGYWRSAAGGMGEEWRYQVPMAYKLFTARGDYNSYDGITAIAGTKCAFEVWALYRKKLFSIYWMHVQKTGSSFWNTVYLYACPRGPAVYNDYKDKATSDGKPLFNKLIHPSVLPDDHINACDVRMFVPDKAKMAPELNKDQLPIGLHYPYHPRYRHAAVTMLRAPAERLISAFYYQQYNGQRMHRPQGFDHVGMTERFEREVHTIVDYARFPGIASCTTKMMLGHYCASPVVLTEEDLAEAKRRLREEFVFVGMTAEWSRSISLFHTQFGELRVKPIELVKINAGRHHAKYEAARLQLLASGWTDRFDTELHDEAKAIFESRCEMYGL
jgi:hypothetical protein